MIAPMMLTLCTIAGQFLFVASTPPNLQLQNVEERDMKKNDVGTDINPGTVRLKYYGKISSIFHYIKNVRFTIFKQFLTTL